MAAGEGRGADMRGGEVPEPELNKPGSSTTTHYTKPPKMMDDYYDEVILVLIFLPSVLAHPRF